MSIDVAQPANRKSCQAIASEWETVARARDDEIRSGNDISYMHVLVPLVLELAAISQKDQVIDAGCGSGYLADLIARDCKNVVGIDSSGTAIALARSHYKTHRGLSFLNSSIESFASSFEGPRFDVAVANMLFQATPDLDGCLEAIGSLITSTGTLIVTLPHPWFWPFYWDYASQPWFSYHRELAIEAPLKTSLNRTGAGTTTHFHRPLAKYLASFA